MIRKMNVKDLDQIMTLWLCGNLDAHPFVAETYWKGNAEMVREMMRQSEIYVWEEQNEILGFAGLQEDYLAGIFVQREARGRGIGKKLLDACKACRPQLTLHVYQKNQNACRFYLREGFQILKQETDEENNETENLLLWKKESEDEKERRRIS